MVRLPNTVEREMFYGAKPNIFEIARELRKNMTPSEKILWDALRKKQLKGFRFRRQHPIDQFIIDFYCHQVRLVIEIDGEVHDLEDQKEYDEGRTAELEDLGLTVIRFKNEEVLNDVKQVVRKIKGILDTK